MIFWCRAISFNAIDNICHSVFFFVFFLRSQSILSGGADNQLIIYDISGGGRRTRSNDME